MSAEERLGLALITYPQHEAVFTSDINAFYDEEAYLDLIFICNNNVQVKAHKIVMSAVSEFIKNMVVSCVQDPIYISIPGVNPGTLRNLLTFLYSGVLKVNKVELADVRVLLNVFGIVLPNAVVMSMVTQKPGVASPYALSNKSENVFVELNEDPSNETALVLRSFSKDASPDVDSLLKNFGKPGVPVLVTSHPRPRPVVTPLMSQQVPKQSLGTMLKQNALTTSQPRIATVQPRLAGQSPKGGLSQTRAVVTQNVQAATSSTSVGMATHIQASVVQTKMVQASQMRLQALPQNRSTTPSQIRPIVQGTDVRPSPTPHIRGPNVPAPRMQTALIRQPVSQVKTSTSPLIKTTMTTQMKTPPQSPQMKTMSSPQMRPAQPQVRPYPPQMKTIQQVRTVLPTANMPPAPQGKTPLRQFRATRGGTKNVQQSQLRTSLSQPARIVQSQQLRVSNPFHMRPPNPQQMASQSMVSTSSVAVGSPSSAVASSPSAMTPTVGISSSQPSVIFVQNVQNITTVPTAGIESNMNFALKNELTTNSVSMVDSQSNIPRSEAASFSMRSDADVNTVPRSESISNFVQAIQPQSNIVQTSEPNTTFTTSNDSVVNSVPISENNETMPPRSDSDMSIYRSDSNTNISSMESDTNESENESFTNMMLVSKPSTSMSANESNAHMTRCEPNINIPRSEPNVNSVLSNEFSSNSLQMNVPTTYSVSVSEANTNFTQTIEPDGNSMPMNEPVRTPTPKSEAIMMPVYFSDTMTSSNLNSQVSIHYIKPQGQDEMSPDMMMAQKQMTTRGVKRKMSPSPSSSVTTTRRGVADMEVKDPMEKKQRNYAAPFSGTTKERLMERFKQNQFIQKSEAVELAKEMNIDDPTKIMRFFGRLRQKEKKALESKYEHL